MRTFRLPAILAALLVAAPAALGAQGLLGFGIYEENDVGRSDSSYTQGARLALLYSLPQRWSEDWQRFQDCTAIHELDVPCVLATLAVGQSIYTPGNIRTPAFQPHSRPYAGWLYVAPGVQLHAQWFPGGLGEPGLLGRPLDLGASLEVPVGVVGRWSFAEEAQSLAHWTFAHGAVRPKGWHHQLEDALVANLRLGAKARLLELCWLDGSPFAHCLEPRARRLFDLLPGIELAAGTVQTHVKYGVTARAGWDLRSDMGPEIIPITRGREEPGARPRPAVRIGLSGSLHRKHVGFNRFIQGGGADDGAGGWRERRRIVLLDRVRERAVGLSLGLGSYHLDIQWVRRGPEFGLSPFDTPEGSFRFTNVTLSRDL